MGTKNTIKQVTIKGFKSIKLLDKFYFGQLNILIGANGVGKSNLISYFRMISEMAQSRLQNWTNIQGSSDRILSYGLKETKKLESFIEFGINGYEFILEPTNDGGFTFSSEKLFFDGPKYGPKWINLGSGHKEALLKKEYKKSSKGSVADYCYSSISNWKVFHFHDTSDTAGVKRQSAVHDNEYLRSDASNLASYLLKLKKDSSDVYEQIRKTVQLAIPFFDDFVLKPTVLATEEETIRLLWCQKNSDYSMWPSQLSDGSIRFICLVTALMQPEPPSTIIIDEPELGLHPFAITLLGSLIRSASKRMQVIISTQSVPLVNEFQISDLIVVDRKEGNSEFSRFDESDFKTWLETYTVGELWEKNILGGRPHK